jgi:mannitol/fructose-specific phosphotransferase system IIA component (Ntr-type)
MPLLIFYLPEGTAAFPTSPADSHQAEVLPAGVAKADAAARVGPSDLFERALEAGRVRLGMPEASINDAIRELLRRHFESDRRSLAHLTALFTEIAQKQPIELEPGVLLLHAHVDEVAEPLVFFGARAEGLRILSLESPARLVVLLCAPASQGPEEHLRTLGEIARLLKGGLIARRMGLGPEDEPPTPDRPS